MVFSPNGTKLACGTACGNVLVFDIKTGNQIAKFKVGEMTEVVQIAFSQDSNWIAACSDYDTFVHIFNLRLGHLVHELEGHTDVVRGLCFSPDDETVASCSFDGTLRVWDYKKGKLLRTIVANIPYSGFCFSPSGATVACFFDDIADILDYKTGKLMQTLDNQTERIVQLAFSLDESMLGSAGERGHVRIWNLKKSKLIHAPHCPQYAKKLLYIRCGTDFPALIWQCHENRPFQSGVIFNIYNVSSAVSRDKTTVAHFYTDLRHNYRIIINNFWYPIQKLLQQHVVNLSKCRHLSSETIFIIFKSLLKRKGYLNFFFDEMFLQFISTCKKAI